MGFLRNSVRKLVFELHQPELPHCDTSASLQSQFVPRKHPYLFWSYQILFSAVCRKRYLLEIFQASKQAKVLQICIWSFTSWQGVAVVRPILTEERGPFHLSSFLSCSFSPGVFLTVLRRESWRDEKGLNNIEGNCSLLGCVSIQSTWCGASPCFRIAVCRWKEIKSSSRFVPKHDFILMEPLVIIARASWRLCWSCEQPCCWDLSWDLAWSHVSVERELFFIDRL